MLFFLRRLSRSEGGRTRVKNLVTVAIFFAARWHFCTFVVFVLPSIIIPKAFLITFSSS